MEPIPNSVSNKSAAALQVPGKLINKKPYTKPRIESYGCLENVTLGPSIGGIDSGNDFSHHESG